jgi:hypothetical protein
MGSIRSLLGMAICKLIGCKKDPLTRILPNDHLPGLAVDLRHHSDLLTPFVETLINADSVDPELSRS